MLHIEVCKQRGDHRLDVCFSAPSPAVVAIFGPSGCGKSTLLNVVAGLLEPDAARIEVDGEALCDTVRGISVPAEQRRLGYVFQDARLFPHLDVSQNLLFGMRRNRIAPARIAFDDVVGLLAIGSLLSRRPHTLSGGERQRVALGRALLAQPRLLLLDEPLAALDAARRDEVLPYIEHLRDQWHLPMLYVSHQFDEVVRLATHLVVLDNGRVASAGPLAEVALNAALRRVVDESAVGAVLDSRVIASDAASGLCRLSAGAGELRVPATGHAPGTRLRVQILARDVIVATQPPAGLSVRNVLAGRITDIGTETPYFDLVTIDTGGVSLLARVTHDATRELALQPDTQVWALVKAVSLRGHGL